MLVYSLVGKILILLIISRINFTYSSKYVEFEPITATTVRNAYQGVHYSNNLLSCTFFANNFIKTNSIILY